MINWQKFFPHIYALVRDGALEIQTPPNASGQAGNLAARTTIQFDGDVINKFNSEADFRVHTAHLATVSQALADLNKELRTVTKYVQLLAFATLAARRLWQAGGVVAVLSGGLSALSLDIPVPATIVDTARQTLVLALTGIALGFLIEAGKWLLARYVRKTLLR